MVVVHKGVAHPWQCDVLGHFTTRCYVAMFDDSSYHFLHAVFGWSGASDSEGKLGWADVRHTTNYLAEVTAGDLLEVRARMSKIGGKSITVLYEMSDVQSGDTVATQEVVCVLFDLVQRDAVTIPDDLRALAEKFT